MADYHRRTAVTRLRVDPEQRRLLEATVDEWRRAANLAASVGWDAEETAKTKLQSLAYDEVREETALGSQHAILAIHEAAQALASARAVERTQATSRPSFTAPTVQYDARSMTLFEDDGSVSLATVESRVRCELVLPDDEDGYQQQYLRDDDWELAASSLTVRDDEFFLHLGFRKPKPPIEPPEDRTVLGVDLGIENVAVTSTAHFESGAELLHERREYERVKAGLQRTGTESARRTLDARSDRERRFCRDYLHRVSNRILAEAEQYDCSHVVFEDLNHIRDSMPGGLKFQEWAHRTLVQFVRYKAEYRGIAVEFVDPTNTSRECAECGHVSEHNRVDRDTFACLECGATANADYNAAKTVGLRYVRRGHQSSRRTGDSRLALKSGTVTPNGTFDPYPPGFEAEDADKSIP